MDLNTHQEVHLSHYWNVIRKRWKIAAAILIVVMTGTFLASWFSKPLYRGKIQMQIERESNAITVEDLFGIAASDQEFLQTQYVLLRSRGLALRVVEDHKLYSDPELNPAGIAGKTPAEIKQIKENIAGGLLGGIEITPVRGTSLVDIAYIGTSPRLAQKVADAWGDSYIRMNIAKKLESVRQASEFLTTQIAAVQADLSLTRKELSDYSRSHGIVAVDGGDHGESVPMTTLAEINTDLQEAQNALYERQARLNSLQNTAGEAVASADLLVLRITDELSRLQREYSQQLTTYREGHPQMKALADQIQKTRTERAAAINAA